MKKVLGILLVVVSSINGHIPRLINNTPAILRHFSAFTQQSREKIAAASYSTEEYNQKKFHEAQYEEFIQAIIKGNLSLVTSYLDGGMDVNHDIFGKKPLHMCARFNQPEIAQLLIKRGADVNAFHQCTPLHIAVYLNYIEVVKVLLAAKPDLSIKDSDRGFTAIQFAQDEGFDAIYQLLLDAGAQKHDYLAWHHAIITDDIPTVRMFIRNAIDINHDFINGMTALHFCAMLNFTEMAQLLINHNADVEAYDKQLGMPLHVAVHNNHIAMVKFLIQNNANVNALDPLNQTPLDLASRLEDPKITDILKKAGAAVSVSLSQFC